MAVFEPLALAEAPTRGPGICAQASPEEIGASAPHHTFPAANPRSAERKPLKSRHCRLVATLTEKSTFSLLH
jgi:hypothetical protein